MTEQIALFPSGPTARGADPVTSKQAGARQPVSSELHGLIRDAVLSSPAGLTDDELVGRFPGRCEGTVKKRRTDLAKAGIVADSGRRRATRTGSSAVVWIGVRP